MIEKHNWIGAKRILFYTALIGLISVYMLHTSMVAEKEVFSKLFLPAEALFVSMAGIKCIWDLADEQFCLGEMILISTVGVLTMILYFTSGKETPLAYWIFIVAAHDIDLREILKVGALTRLFMLFLIIGLCYRGVLENRMYVQGARIRQGIGFDYIYSTAYFYCFCLEWTIYRKENISYTELILLTFGAAFFYSKTDTLNYLLFTGIVLLCGFVLKSSPLVRQYRTGYNALAILLPVVSSGITLWISSCFHPDNAILHKLDVFFHNRLYLSNKMLNEKGIHWLGQRIEWLNATSEKGVYNFVDSSYIQTLLIYGWFLCALLLVGLVIWGISIAKEKDTYFLMGLWIMSLHWMIEPELMILPMNLFLMSYNYIKQAGTNSEKLSNGMKF